MSEYIIDMGNSSYQSTSGLLCADASYLREEIVRCRDCGHCYTCGSFMFCEFRRPGEPVNADGYCAWAERRDAE